MTEPHDELHLHIAVYRRGRDHPFGDCRSRHRTAGDLHRFRTIGGRGNESAQIEANTNALAAAV